MAACGVTSGQVHRSRSACVGGAGDTEAEQGGTQQHCRDTSVRHCSPYTQQLPVTQEISSKPVEMRGEAPAPDLQPGSQAEARRLAPSSLRAWEGASER